MAVPNTSPLFTAFDNIVSTTWRNVDTEIYDNLSNHNALYNKIASKGNVKIKDGGLNIAVILEYAANSTYTRYSGYDTVNVADSEVFTNAEFPWKQISIAISSSGLQLRQNSGRSEIVDLGMAKVKNARNTFTNLFTVDLYSDGTAANQITGLQALVSDTGVGTVGGINSGAFPFWQNKVQSAASPLGGGGAITLSATTIENFMNMGILYATRGADKPDLIVMSRELYAMFEASQVVKQRNNGTTDASAGFTTLKFHNNIDVTFDDAIPAYHMYFLNTKYLYVFAHKYANLDLTDDRSSVNQDAVTKLMLWQGNLACSNRSLQVVGKL